MGCALVPFLNEGLQYMERPFAVTARFYNLEGKEAHPDLDSPTRQAQAPDITTNQGRTRGKLYVSATPEQITKAVTPLFDVRETEDPK